MKQPKVNIPVAAVLLFTALFLTLLWFINQNRQKPVLENPSQINKQKLLEKTSHQENSLVGKILSISPSARTVTIATEDKKQVVLLLTPTTKIINQNNIKESFSALYRGFTVTASGVANSDDSFTAAEIQLITTPAILVYTPKENQIVGKVFEVSGVARVFENSFALRLKNNKTDTQYIRTIIKTNAANPGSFGEFKLKVEITNQTIQDDDLLSLELFQVSTKDGSEVDKVRIPLIYKANH
jgi:hypothetical protein